MFDCCYIYDKAILLHLWVKLYYIHGGSVITFMVKCYYIYDGHYIYASFIQHLWLLLHLWVIQMVPQRAYCQMFVVEWRCHRRVR